MSDDRTRTWLPVVFVIKAVLFAYFGGQFYGHWEPALLTKGIAVSTGDSPGYYNPAEHFVQGEGYDSACRMPALVPLYAPFSFLLGADNAKVAMVVLQFLLSVISVIALGRWAQFLWKKPYVFQGVVLLYSISSFVSIWDHYLMSDSFSTSFFIFSLYFLSRHFEKESYRFVFLSGLFLAWAVFFRQVFLIAYPAVALLLFFGEKKNFTAFFKSGLAFIFPLTLAVGMWSQYTKVKTGERIWLVAPLENCFATYTGEYQALAGFMIDMGYGEPFWTEGSLPQWMLRSRENMPMPPVPERHFTSVCNADSLVLLREQYRMFIRSSGAQQDSIGQIIQSRVKLYREVYKSEHPLNFYFLNRLRHAKIFLLPMRVDNLPGPSYPEMNPLEKAVKIFYIFLFGVVVIFGVIAMILQMRKSVRIALWYLIPFSIFIALALVLGYVEQRYFVPVYPLMVVTSVAAIVGFIEKQNPGNGTDPSSRS